ncbi:PEP/pyruvate-binding domain-containing protein [Pseudonocardia endophytica]|uniref:PEP/pyruvate-binding domain-containing protein n=1 Tax=Pseudonocardia endophytica TaxID=401976 RepID=UPI001053E95B|nr:PEP/pyruvate-binding domain-containing protein [Pseudonocardia endophytica]
MTTYTRRFDELGATDVETAGGKGANLGELTRAGLPVPPGFVVVTPAYDAFVAANGLQARIDAGGPAEIRAAFEAGTAPEPVAAAVTAALTELGSGPLAVRSSATVEDVADTSAAGQQDTYLNVEGPDAVLDAVRRCWASLFTDRALAYRASRRIAPEGVRLAVVVQRMADAEASGVMFTANPSNGRRDQLVIGAAWGLGESVVGGTVSTDDHVVDAATGAVLSRTVADKTVMTVPTPTGTEERPVPPERRRAPVLDDDAVRELAALGTRIAAHYGSPQDVEWVRTPLGFVVVQSRPVTALPEPMADPPADWPIPYDGGWYFRASIVEQMPDPLTPLFADLVDGAVTRSITRLMNGVMGHGAVRDGDVSLPTVNGYAYYFYRTSSLVRMLGATPTALRAMAGRPVEGAPPFGLDGWRDRAHPEYERTVADWTARDAAGLTPSQRYDGVVALLDAGCVYYTSVQSIIPLAATSELAFRAFHDRLVRRDGEPAGYQLLLGFDSRPVLAEKSLFDLATAARTDGVTDVLTGSDGVTLAGHLPPSSPPDGADPDAWTRWCARLAEHLDRYGHTVYNLDFADPVPADDPAPVLDSVRFHLLGSGTDPYTRQRAAAGERDRWTRDIDARLDPLRRRIFTALLSWAQDTGPVREDALADMGLAWPLMRRMLLGIGAGLVDAGTVDEPADVFWLRGTELRSALDGGADPDLRARIAERRMLWRGRRTVTAPQLLPEHPAMKALLARVMPASDQAQTGATITGVAASGGRVTAPARVVDGPGGFADLRPGEVLVARITTPAWTPLFTRAAAVVTDVGGPLSHSSIVAREYGIPAVLGTGSATGRIRTGQQVLVDGDRGAVTLLEDGATPEEPDAPSRRTGAVLAVAGGLGAAAVLAVRRRRRRASG